MSKPLIVSSSLTYLPVHARELLGDEERLREELLHLARTRDGELVLLGELVHAEDGDDVLEVLVALQNALDLTGHTVVLLADDRRVERARGGLERVDGRVDAHLGDATRENRGGVEVGERRCRRRVGDVVGRDVDGLDRRDRTGLGRRDALLQVAHLGGQRGLVASGGRHAAEKRRDLRARLGEAEDVVDEEQNVLALVAEVLAGGQAGETDAQTRSGRLVHLTVDENGLLDDARLLHLVPEVGALTGALAHAGEHGRTTVRHGEVVDELHDDDGLADARTAEEAGLAALDVGLEQVDDLDAGLEDLGLGLELFVGRRRSGGSGRSA